MVLCLVMSVLWCRLVVVTLLCLCVSLVVWVRSFVIGMWRPCDRLRSPVSLCLACVMCLGLSLLVLWQCVSFLVVLLIGISVLCISVVAVVSCGLSLAVCLSLVRACVSMVCVVRGRLLLSVLVVWVVTVISLLRRVRWWRLLLSVVTVVGLRLR